MPVLLLNLLATTFMTGLIWFVQVVHYPLFGQVPREGFPSYAKAHQRRTTLVVGPPMLVEAATAIGLVWSAPAGIPPWAVWFGIGLVGVVWASTAALQVPEHSRLVRGLDLDSVRRLVASNWIRTAAWSARTIVATWMVWTATTR